MLLLAAALAAENECQACCRAAGVAECELTLRVYGEESESVRERGGHRADGLYVVSCDGRAFFDDERIAYFMSSPTAGELAMPESDPRAIDCFLASCQLPRDACVGAPDGHGRRHLQDCVTKTALDAYAIRRAPGAGRTPIPVAVAPIPVPAAPLPTVIVVEGAIVAHSAAPPPPVARADPFAGGLPVDPPAECRPPSDALFQAARAQVLSADDQRIRGDLAEALAGYRAAVTMDTCSGYGWVGLGQGALALGRPDVAVRALKNATRLMPGHYGAWVELGRAYEAILQVAAAHTAYATALALKADLAEADSGFRRTMPR